MLRFNDKIEYDQTIQWLKQNSTALFYIFMFLVNAMVAFPLFKTLMLPIDKHINLREKRRVLDEKLNDAKALLAENKIYSASKLLVECAESSTLSQSKQQAQYLLKSLSKR